MATAGTADSEAYMLTAGSPVRPENVPVLQQDAASNATLQMGAQGQGEGNVVHPNQGAPRYPAKGTTIHTLCTSNGSPYLNFQTRIMCATAPGFERARRTADAGWVGHACPSLLHCMTPRRSIVLGAIGPHTAEIGHLGHGDMVYRSPQHGKDHGRSPRCSCMPVNGLWHGARSRCTAADGDCANSGRHVPPETHPAAGLDQQQDSSLAQPTECRSSTGTGSGCDQLVESIF